MGKNPDGSSSIETVGDYIDEGYDSYVYCNNCRHKARQDLQMLAEKLGRDHSMLASKLRPRLRCSQCGSKDMSFSVATNKGWDGTGGHSLSGHERKKKPGDH